MRKRKGEDDYVISYIVHIFVYMCIWFAIWSLVLLYFDLISSSIVLQYENTIAISSEEEDHRELAKRLMSDPLPLNLCGFGEGQARSAHYGGSKRA